MTNLFLVEDHELIRATLITILERETDFTVVGKAASGAEALTLLPQLKVDLLLIDISMPDMDGLVLLKKVQAQWPDIICLMLSGHAEAVYGEQARAGGALAYIDKRNVREIVPTIRRVLADINQQGGAS